ncbi:MAG: hypothetical protein A4E53_02214 [Pelotomaculum sp. PtaB.Bin104]|nr:MAG: hypothetical protein A4E53_02214 [Pelotomaculum sp. PtaB.Bin104]
MNKVKTTATVAVVVLVISILSYAAFAGTGDEPGGSNDPLVTRSYVDQYVQWQVADMKTGQKLVAQAGTELIIRRGQATVVDPAGNGIPDITVGADIHAGAQAPVNHLLVVPRDDGRGVKAQSPVVIMYRGGASIQ